MQFLVTESLIRAMELRINNVPEPKAGAELDATIRAGGVLARHFYEALQTFETSPEGIRLFYPTMVKSIVMDKVTSAFAEAQKTVVVVEKKPEPTELDRLLRDANVQLGNNHLEIAADQFQKVLETHDASNGQALYGLGIVASMQNRREIAKEYFSRALQSASSEKGTKVWSHIYLGRILDLEENRQGPSSNINRRSIWAITHAAHRKLLGVASRSLSALKNLPSLRKHHAVPPRMKNGSSQLCSPWPGEQPPFATGGPTHGGPAPHATPPREAILRRPHPACGGTATEENNSPTYVR